MFRASEHTQPYSVIDLLLNGSTYIDSNNDLSHADNKEETEKKEASAEEVSDFVGVYRNEWCRQKLEAKIKSLVHCMTWAGLILRRRLRANSISMLLSWAGQ